MALLILSVQTAHVMTDGKPEIGRKTVRDNEARRKAVMGGNRMRTGVKASETIERCSSTTMGMMR